MRYSLHLIYRVRFRSAFCSLLSHRLCSRTQSLVVEQARGDCDNRSWNNQEDGICNCFYNFFRVPALMPGLSAPYLFAVGESHF